MSFEEALRTRIKAAIAGAAPVEWESRKGYPCIVLSIVTQSIGRHMTGDDGLRSPRVQIDALALDNPTKVALRDAAVAAITPAGVVGGVRFGRAQQLRWSNASEQTDTDFVFREMIEAVLPHQLET